MRVLDLFSGTGSVKKACDHLRWNCVTVDISNQHHDHDIVTDILTWNYKTLPPDSFDIVWASFPCRTFSKLRYTKMTKERIEKDIQEIGLPLLRKAQEIIAYFKPTYWFMENPASSSARSYISDHSYVVDYCQYSDWGYQKPTRIWTNKETFVPKRCHANCPNKINGKHIVCIGGSKSMPRKLSYRIPMDLILSLFSS
jgi:site-specific DNA-cytosine methylase